ncbi:Checkpoint kinase 2 [Physocladia obscura]|uniref:Checkpoint kinase 2 n=1 Tax=Physocladia obscura TaxID=109957 RepID=A0AAD5T627_9FUNG|nr:Checkpoint kinase 2 [Physocladia obscura]
MTACGVCPIQAAQLVTPPQSPDSKHQEINSKSDKTDSATTDVEITTTIPTNSEEKARAAVQSAFKHSNRELTIRFKVKAIVGFGANGVILAAIDSLSMSNVAIKIIYKTKSQINQQQPPKEIASLVSLNEKCRSKLILRAHCAWQDWFHFYLVTNLFGSNWATSNMLEPITFKTQSSKTMLFHSFPFSTGASDLWAWSAMYRSAANSALLSSRLPSHVVKHIAHSCFTAVSEIHESGFYHGDIKLENILVQKTHDDTKLSIMIADFGQTERVEHRIMHYGTVEMSAPEFLPDSPFNNAGVIEAAWIDGRGTDVFALGMMLFLLLSETGVLPAVVSDGGRGYHELFAANNGKFPFYDDEIADFEEIALGLVDGMCRVDPAERFTLQEALKHEWFN